LIAARALGVATDGARIKSDYTGGSTGIYLNSAGLEDQAVILAAGTGSQRLFDPDCREDDWGDRMLLYGRVACHNPNTSAEYRDKVMDGLWTLGFKRATALLRANWLSVCRVAGELLRKSQLNEAEIRLNTQGVRRRYTYAA
jgi:hypothetical protein